MKSYLKFLSRNKLYTQIEAVGLVVSLAFVIYMCCYVVQQVSVTRETPDYERIYIPGRGDYSPFTMFIGACDVFEGRIPELEFTCRYISDYSYKPATFRDKQFDFKAAAVDKNFFEMFPQYEFVEGSADVFDVKDNIIVSESFAAELSDEDIIGKSIVFFDKEYTIGAVIKDFKNTLIPYYDILTNINAPFSGYLNKNNSFFNGFADVVYFMKVREGTNPAELKNKLDAVSKDIREFQASGSKENGVPVTRLDKVFFMNDTYGLNKGNKEQLLILIIIAVIALFSALLNYVNLNSALLGMRAKEMAVNRILGASKYRVLSKYLMESVLFTGVCMFLALLLAVMVTPMMNGLLHADVATSIPFSPLYICGYILLILVIGVFNALFPAYISSRYKPVDVIKGKQRAESKGLISKILIILQAVLAVGMISITIVMEAQYRKSLYRERNHDSENLLYLDKYDLDEGSSAVLLDKLRTLSCVKEIGLAENVPGHTTGTMNVGTKDGGQMSFSGYMMDTASFGMMNFRILEDFGGKSLGGVWLGEQAYNVLLVDGNLPRCFSYMNYETGEMEFVSYSDPRYIYLTKEEVRGVIADFPVDLTNTMEAPMIQLVALPSINGLGYINYLIEVIGDKQEAKEQILKVYREHIEEVLGVYVEPETCEYIDEIYRKGLAEYERQMRLIEVFMIIAVLLSLMGMVAMSTYEAQVRRHDIALRKVHGATVGGEVVRGVLSYMKMILLASVVAVPVAVWLADRYLQQFIVKIESYWWIFALAILLTALISFLSILWQTLRAARTNPVDVLNKE